jgi:hypothetical protein
MPEGSLSYRRLWELLSKTMKTQHVYQPVMLKTLLQGDGRASTRPIAAAFLSAVFAHAWVATVWMQHRRKRLRPSGFAFRSPGSASDAL